MFPEQEDDERLTGIEDDDDAKLERHIALALMPPESGVLLSMELVKVGADLDSLVPGVGAMVKGLVAVGAWA